MTGALNLSMSPFRLLQFPAHTGSSWRSKAFSILYMIFQDSLTCRSIVSASSSMKLPSIHSLCHFFPPAVRSFRPPSQGEGPGGG